MEHKQQMDSAVYICVLKCKLINLYKDSLLKTYMYMCLLELMYITHGWPMAMHEPYDLWKSFRCEKM